MLDRGEGLDKDDCLAAMLSGDSMSREDMKDHFMTLISAGHDTTAYFCSYTAYILSLHQDIQEKVIAEINDIIGNREEITADDFTSLKYLQKVMQEVMRVFAIIPMITRYCPEEVHIKEAKIVIPAGSNILVPMFLINRDPDIWEDPQKFDPDRFDENSNFTSAKNGFFPFGYGTRTCIGNTLAQIEGCVFLVKLIKKYKLLPDPNFKPTILAGISLTTSNGLNVKLESR
jgi:cytochrome P450